MLTIDFVAPKLQHLAVPVDLLSQLALLDRLFSLILSLLGLEHSPHLLRVRCTSLLYLATLLLVCQFHILMIFGLPLCIVVRSGLLWCVEGIQKTLPGRASQFPSTLSRLFLGWFPPTLICDIEQVFICVTIIAVKLGFLIATRLIVRG